MPEVRFRVRWPDGEVESCYSPSTIIRDHLRPGRAYAPAEFLQLCRAGLDAASARVALRYGGSGCALAGAQLAAIERRVAGLQAGEADEGSLLVRVEGFED